MSIKKVLFDKVDLDTLATALVMGVDPVQQAFRSIKGSASAEELEDPENLCIEVGGAGEVGNNNFDHHGSKAMDLSACAQALERLARLIRYVDQLDRGELAKIEDPEFPSLTQLVSGMLICIKDPEMQMERGLEIFREVLDSGIDPYGCMESILDQIPEARQWTQAKREHDKQFAQVLDVAQWFTSASGKKVAVVETDWFGAPGALYGAGAEIVVALNPRHEQGGIVYRKFTVAGNSVVVQKAIEKLDALEKERNPAVCGSWGGPATGTIGGSPRGESSILTLDEVSQVVLAEL